MAELGRIVNDTLQINAGVNIEDLGKSIALGLENRLSGAIHLNVKFKDAKKAFQKAYFTELLTLSRGNVSKAAALSNLNRRHIHRVCAELELNPESFRKEMLRPKEYLKSNVAEVIEKNIVEYMPRKAEKLYENLSVISEKIAENIEIRQYNEAIGSFERQYFENLLKQAHGDVEKAADFAGISQRSIFRKLKALQISA